MMNPSNGWQQFLPNVAISGNFFRTVEFMHPAAENMQSWMEAMEHPLTNLWQISEVTRRPNTISAGEGETKLIEESRTILKDLGLIEALEKLGEYELAQKAMGFVPVGKTAKQLGAEHVAQFAKNEGCILVKDKIHPVVNGRLVSDGIFPDGTREEARQVKTTVNPVRAAARFDLSHLFRSSAQVQDFSRLLTTQIDQEKWDNFVKKMMKVVKKLDVLQHDRYSPAKTNKVYIFAEETVAGKAEFLNAIMEARQELTNFRFLNNAQRQMCEKFFEEALLSYEIGYAKHTYQIFIGAGLERKIQCKAALEKQTDKTLQTCRKFGGSEADCQRIQAEIIGPSTHAALVEANKNLHAKLCNALDLSWVNNLISTQHYSYFMPESLFEPLIVLNQIGKVFERAIDEEKNRIYKDPNQQGPKI